MLDHDPAHGQERGIFWVEMGVLITVSGTMTANLLRLRRPGTLTAPWNARGALQPYGATVFLMVIGLYVVFARGNLIKKLIGLGIFQTSVYILYIGPGKILGGSAPIIATGFTAYSNPLPHVLILTAIVVGVATLALGFAIVVRIHEAYGTIEEDEILSRTRAR